jgi:SAM-dependent methyltransferase
MQDAHQFVWEAMLESVDVPVAQKRILDVGCNRGGFLRYLADSFHIGEGFGYDPAAGAIQDARALAGGRPLTFEAAEGVPTAWGGFDVAFSHEVLYLLHDLKAHASALFEALVPGGVYFAVMGVHSASPMIAEWHQDNRESLSMPALYNLDDVAETFGDAGFNVALGRLPIRFMPATGHTTASRGAVLHDAARQDLLGWLEYYYEHKVIWRFRRPAM